MIGKLIRLLIKSALSPLFVALSAYRKAKYAVLKLVGGSKRAGSAAAGAADAATDTAASAAERRAAESTPESNDAARTAGSSSVERRRSGATTTDPASPDGHAGPAAFCLVLAVGQIILQIDALAWPVTDAFEQAWVFRITPITDVLVWLWLQPSPQYFTLVGWGYGAVLAGLGTVSYLRLSTTLRRGASAFFGANLVLFWVLVLFWEQYGGVGEFLAGTLLYTLLMFVGLGLFAAAEPSRTVERRASAGPAGESDPVGASSAADERRPSDATAVAESTDASPSDPAGDGSAAGADDVDRSATAADAAARESTAADADRDGAASGDADPAGEADAGPTNGGRDAAVDVDTERVLADLRDGTATPEAVRSLGDRLPDDDLPGEAVTALERGADASDPEMRLAVCEVCATLEDDRARELLKRRRIDPDDRVANAAVEGLGDG
jgi:hypothetical protein